LSTSETILHLPPVHVLVYVRDTEKSVRGERRLNEGISAATAATFVYPGRSRGEEIWRRILTGVGAVAAFAMCAAVIAALFALPHLRDGEVDQAPMGVALAAAVVLGFVMFAGFIILERKEGAARVAAADRALPYLSEAPLRVTSSDDSAFTDLCMKLGSARNGARYSPAREAELFAATRALADYRRTPAPDPTAKRMNDAAHLFSDRAVKQLAREYRTAKAAKAVAWERASRLVEAFVRAVEDENLVAAARKRVAAGV
jgi:hypothetical protein